GDGGGPPSGARRLDRDARRRPAERPGRPGAALGDAARSRRGPRLAGDATRRLVEAPDQPLGQLGPEPGPRPGHPRYGMLGPDLSARPGSPLADVSRGPPLPRPRAAPRRVPDRPGAGKPPAAGARPVALQPPKPFDPGGRRPARGRLALAAAEPLPGRRRSDCDVGRGRRSVRRPAGGLSDGPDNPLARPEALGRDRLLRPGAI